MRAWLSLFLVAGLSLLSLPVFLGCPAPASNEILIGHYASMTGSEATFGQSTDKGILLAIEELNAAGGIGGKKVKLITYDDKGDVKEAGNAVSRLVTRDRVVVVLGEVASGLSLAGAPVCQQYGVPMISPSSTNPKVTKVGDMIFRVCFIDPFQGAVCAKFARTHEGIKAQKAAILYDQKSPYSVGLYEEFKKNFIADGGEIATEQAYQAGDQDFTPQMTSIRAANVDVIYVPGYYTDVGNIALQARKLGVTKPLLGGDGWDSSKLAEIAGDAIEGSYYSNHYSHQDPNSRVQEFIRKYKEKHNQVPDGLAALGYDAARIFFQAMGNDPNLKGKELAAKLAATQDFDGVTGKITLDKDRNAVKPAVMLEMKKGEPTFVSAVEPNR